MTTLMQLMEELKPLPVTSVAKSTQGIFPFVNMNVSPLQACSWSYLGLGVFLSAAVPPWLEQTEFDSNDKLSEGAIFLPFFFSCVFGRCIHSLCFCTQRGKTMRAGPFSSF
jgi:hypothetical protein